MPSRPVRDDPDGGVGAHSTLLEWENRLAGAEAEAEAAYAEMYDARSAVAITGCYSGAKQAYFRAIAIADHLGRTADVTRLKARYEHLRGVFASQFASLT